MSTFIIIFLVGFGLGSLFTVMVPSKEERSNRQNESL